MLKGNLSYLARQITRENLEDSISKYNKFRPRTEQIAFSSETWESMIGGYLLQSIYRGSTYLSEKSFNQLYDVVEEHEDGFVNVVRSSTSFIEFAKNNPDEGEK